MTRRLARRLHAVLAAALSAALVLLSPGLEAPRLFAQAFRAAPPEALPSAPAASAAASTLSPAASGRGLAAPALGSPAVLAAAAIPSARAAALSAPFAPGVAAALAPHLAAAADPSVGAAAAYAASRGIEDALTSQRSAGEGDVAGAPAGAPAFAASGLSAAAADAGPDVKTDAVPAAAAPAAAPRANSAASYKMRRLLLQMTAALTGGVYTLPAAGPALTESLIASAADRRAVLSDFDDTLAHFNERLPPDMVAAVSAIRAAGKTFDVISDRGDEKRGTALIVFESLDTLPVETRAGMYAAVNSGGRVYRYDESGTPVKVYEAPPMTDDVKSRVAAAAEATKARLAEAGAVQHDGIGKVPAESWGPYSYALMLKPGSSEAAVRGVAAILQSELDSRGVDVEAAPRFAKDPANPPYVALSIITKEAAARYIAQARKASAEDVVILGDSMYVPHAPRKASWLTRLGERASGQPLATLGNRTDANMERAVPGALTLSVGTTGDPRAKNLYVLAGKGPSVAYRVLASVASLPAGAPRRGSALETAAAVAGGLAIVAVAVAAIYGFAHAAADWLMEMERGLHDLAREPAAIFGMASGAAALFGLGTLGAPRGVLSNPADDYSAARKQAIEIAVQRGAKADDVLFVEATAALPVADAEHWKYSFEIPGKNGARTLVYVDSRRFLGGPADMRATLYEGAQAPTGRRVNALPAYLFAMGVKVEPQSALDAVRREAPTFGARASASLDFREEPVSGDRDLWYRFYDEKGGVASVNARTAEVRLESARASALASSISPASPIEGFSTFVYDAGLAAAKSLAVKAGYAPDNLRVQGASLSPRAWGEDWTFRFVSPRQDSAKGPRGFSVTVRRTMVSETQVDAIAAKDEGPLRLFAGVPAEALPELVKVSPMEAIAKTGPDASALELQARWPDGEGPTQLWYVARDAKGRELKAINAATGVETVPAPYAWVSSFATWLAGAALVAVIYGGIYYAIAHAPAATSATEFPVPGNIGIGSLFGAGLLGLGGMLGRGAKAAPKQTDADPKPTDADVRARASAVMAYKGYPWSQTEYNSVYYPALESLKSGGATAEQLALFERLCAEAPLRGGRFNPWSGD